MADKLSLATWICEAQNAGLSFGDFAIGYQAKMRDTTATELLQQMCALVDVMEQSVRDGLKGERSRGGLVGGDAKKMQHFYSSQPANSVIGPELGRAIMMAIAVGEANASMSRIVAAPTAGSSGVLPAVLFFLQDTKHFDRDKLARMLLVAGSIGMVISSRATLAGAVGGCQAECGAAAAMAAGGCVDVCGGSPEQVGHAVAIAFKNILGLVCDPVGGLVEVPCVKRNAGCTGLALVAAEMALAGINSVIPVDEVIDTMYEVGRSLPSSLRETSQGGLAATPTAQRFVRKMRGIQSE